MAVAGRHVGYAELLDMSSGLLHQTKNNAVFLGLEGMF
jgi:hypothetical protein